MSGWPAQIVWSFLEKVGVIAKAPVAVPDFADLFEQPEDEIPGEIKRVTPDIIDEAVDLGVEQADIADKQAAEELRVAAQQDVIAGLKLRSDSVPAQPEPAKLAILDTADVNKVSTSVEIADKDFQALSGARGQPDEAFKTATDQAKSALDARDGAIKGLHDALASEITRRRDAITALQDKADLEKKKIGPDVTKLLEVGGRQKSIATLKAALPVVDTAITSLTASVESAAPAKFKTGLTDATALVDALPLQIANVAGVVANMRTEKRKTAVADLKPSLPTIQANDLTILPTSDLATQLSDAAAAHKKSHDALAKLPLTTAQDAFDTAESETASARDAAVTAHSKISQAITAERGRRDLAAKALDKRYDGIVAPDLIYGTAEASTYSKARLKVRSAIELVKGLASAGTPGAFDDAGKVAGTALDELTEAGLTAATEASTRATELTRLRTALAGQVRPLGAKITAMSASPVPTVVKAAQDAIKKEVDATRGRINGKDLVADALEVTTFTAFALKATQFLTTLDKLAAASFTPVSDNKTIKADIETLVAQLSKVGIATAATELAETLVKDVDKITDDYLAIDQLVSRYDDIKADPNATSHQKTSLQEIPFFQKSRANFAKGEIAKMIGGYLNLVRPIEADLEKKRETADYLASPAYTFIQLMETNDATVISELEALVTAATATRGPINSAYRSSYDNPDRFSVEVATPIDGRAGVVVHAHCQTDGNPQPNAGACHVKLYKYRFDPGGVVLSATLRGSLIPSAANNLAKAKAAKLVA